MITRDCPIGLINAIRHWCPDIKSIELPIFAGGFIRAYFAGETPSDLDIYFRNEGDLNKVQDELKSAGWENVFETERAITLKKNSKLVQLIKFVYAGPIDLLNNFDFTICCASAFIVPEGDKGTIYLHDDFFEHLAGRLLVFQGSSMPLASLRRAFKYVKRGYHICDENIIRLAEAIAATVDFDDENNVQEHIAGMDPLEDGRRIRVID